MSDRDIFEALRDVARLPDTMLWAELGVKVPQARVIVERVDMVADRLDAVTKERDDARAYVEELREALRATGEERDRLAAARDRLAGDVQEADTRLSEAMQAKQRAEAERDDARERLRLALDACTELSMALAAHGIKLRRADKAHTMLAAELSSARQELETHRCDTAAHSDVQTDTQEITDDRT